MQKFKHKTSFIIVLLILISTVKTSFAATTFNDLGKIEWAKPVIEKWAENGLIGGYSDGTFRPSNNITRAEFVTLVNKTYGFEEKASILFKDVNELDWYAEEVEKAVSAGYISGYENGSFKPNEPITRGEVAAILSNINKLTKNEDAVKDFSDKDKMPEWVIGYIGAVVNENYMSGYPDGTFQAGKTISRAESVITLNNTEIYETNQPTGLVISLAGNYGGVNSNYQTEKNDVEVRSGNVILSNMIIEGDLILGKEINGGNVTLDKVILKGKLNVEGSSLKSLKINNSRIQDCNFEKADNVISISTQGTSTIANVYVNSALNFKEQNLLADMGFNNIEINEGTKGEMSFEGDFAKVIVNEENIKVKVLENSEIDDIVLYKSISILGKGNINKATVFMDGASFETAPKEIILGANTEVTVIISGETQKITSETLSKTFGGGGGATAVSQSELNEALGRVVSDFKIYVIPKLTTTNQIEAAQIILFSMENYLSDNGYDISFDVEKVQEIGSNMAVEEKEYFKDTISGNISFSDLRMLNDKFQLISY